MAIDAEQVEKASDPSVGEELLNVPMGEIIKSMAFAIADAQFRLDEQAMNVAALMSGAVFHQYEETEAMAAARVAVREARARLAKAENASPRVETTVTAAETDRKAKQDAVNALADKEAKAREGTSHAIKGTLDPSTAGWFEDTRIQFGYKFSLDDDGKPTQEPAWVSMMELGFSPTFYQFVDTIIEVKITVSITKSREKGIREATYERKTDAQRDSQYAARAGRSFWGRSAAYSASASSNSSTNVNASSVNGTYAAKYGFDASGSSLLRTKLKPIPAPTIFEDRVRQIMRLNAAYAAYTMTMEVIDLMERQPIESDADFDSRKAALPANQREAATKQLETQEQLDTRKEGARKAATQVLAGDMTS